MRSKGKTGGRIAASGVGLASDPSNPSGAAKAVVAAEIEAGAGSGYDLEALRAAIADWEDAEPGEEAGRAWARFERALDPADMPAILFDAALGRALRAAAERDGPERRVMVGAMCYRDEFREANAASAAGELIGFVETGYAQA